MPTSGKPGEQPSSPAEPLWNGALVLGGDRAKRWMKTYRTEVAASSSSILSTCAAVSDATLSSTTLLPRGFSANVGLAIVSLGLSKDSYASVSAG